MPQALALTLLSLATLGYHPGQPVMDAVSGALIARLPEFDQQVWPPLCSRQGRA